MSILARMALNRIAVPRCHNMQELPTAATERARVEALLSEGDGSALETERTTNALSRHLLRGLAYTTGSALGTDPPTRDECRSAFTASATNSGLTAGAKAWSKHAHRSGDGEEGVGWWGGRPRGPVASINAQALSLFDKVMDGATWQNLHWLPHEILVYEARVEAGYGMRWAQDRTNGPWLFRGFVEPMMENGHELGWRH